jgi:hypothetical protein
LFDLFQSAILFPSRHKERQRSQADRSNGNGRVERGVILDDLFLLLLLRCWSTTEGLNG